MRVYKAPKYKIIGFRPEGEDSLSGWVLRECSSQPDFQPETVIVDECKFINDGVVYFLKRNGEIQTNRRLSLGNSQLAYVYCEEGNPH